MSRGEWTWSWSDWRYIEGYHRTYSSSKSQDDIVYSKTHRYSSSGNLVWRSTMKDAMGTHQFVSEEEAGETHYHYPMNYVCKVCKCWLSSDGVIFKRGTWEVAPKKCHLMVLW